MIFLIFLIVGILSMFGIGQVMGMHKREKNVASTFYSRLNELKNNLQNKEHKQEKKAWWQFWKKEDKKNFLERVLDIGDQNKK